MPWTRSSTCTPWWRRSPRGVGTDAATYGRDRPGMSAFVEQDGAIYHTYSTYARGLDHLWNMYQWLDRAPLGRNESGLLVEAPR